MRKRVSWPLRAVAILVALWLVPEATLARESGTAEASSCRAECGGLGVDKVKAGDEHCGLVARKRKRIALEAACELAESKREELQATARERAESRCGHVGERAGCRCRGRIRRWENVYTNHLSQRCWAECGWIYQLECERGEEPPAGADEEDGPDEGGPHGP